MPPAAKKATSSAGKATVKKTVGTAAKAVGAEAAGGGPENPAADIAAVKAVASPKNQSSGGSPAGGGSPTAKKSSGPPAGKKNPPSSGSRTTRTLSWAWSGSRNLLGAEYIIIVVILGLGALTTTGSVKDELPKLMVKFSAVSLVFMLASLVADTGKSTARAVGAVTTLITVAYVLTSPESHQAVSFIGAYFAPPKNAGK